MKSSFFALLIVLLPLIYGCEDQIKDPQNINITYTMIDSVSPMRVVLRVNKDLIYAEWIINDSIFVNDGGIDSVVLILDKPGINHIDLVATDKDIVHYEGSIDIDVPNTASKLQINGFFFKNNIKLPIDRDSVQLKVYHNNDIDNPVYVRYYATSDFLAQDTFILTVPIVLDVFNSVDIADAKSSNLYFSIEDVPIYSLDDLPKGFSDGTLSGQIHKRYFSANVDVKQAYWDCLIMAAQQIQMSDYQAQSKEVRLLVNWKR